MRAKLTHSGREGPPDTGYASPEEGTTEFIYEDESGAVTQEVGSGYRSAAESNKENQIPMGCISVEKAHDGINDEQSYNW